MHRYAAVWSKYPMEWVLIVLIPQKHPGVHRVQRP